MRYYEYRHTVGFEETSLVGTVYYTNHVHWQGRCREMFLREHAPEVLDSLAGDFALVTMSVSCEYLAELAAFDEVIVRMRLGALKQNRITMLFEYWRTTESDEELVGRGAQEVACMTRKGSMAFPIRIPSSLLNALAPYLQTENGTSSG